VKARIGLTGGIGSGKSEAARVFSGLGALLVDADALAREAVAPGSEGFAAIARRWPEALRDGALDRAALARIVFADPAARDELNAIVHPIVRRLADAREREAAPEQLVVHDVPLLFENDYYRRCDANVLVLAPLEERLERVMRRSGLSRAAVEERMAAQIDPARARELADFTLKNDGSLEQLRARAAALYRELLAVAPTRSLE
jgi:dephospho-CoA kinase